MNESGGTLVVGPAWVGDMVMAQSLFKTLKRQNPERPIDVIAPTWSLPLLQRMPEVRYGHRLAAGHGQFALTERLRLGRTLRAQDYSQAIVLPRSLKSAIAPWAAQIPRRTGYRGEWRYGLLNDIRALGKSRLKRTVDRYVALGRESSAEQPPPILEPRLSVDHANQQRLMKTFALTRNDDVIALLPGAEYGPAKQWPIVHFRALAEKLVEKGYQCWIFGSAKEAAIGGAISADLQGVNNLCGKTELTDVVDLLAICKAVVTNDSGLMHIAAAVGSYVVAIYGATSPHYTPPLTSTATVLSLGLECSPCHRRVCPLGHTRCLTQIAPDAVVDVLER